MAEWQPIETAPKDGTDIIVGRDIGTVWVVHVAWYRTLEEIQEMEGMGDWAPEHEGWWSYTRSAVSQEHLMDTWRRPTHWMPLPAPPGM